MDVEDEILHSLWHYPTIFASRSAVLEHLFLIIGNGYEWDNGQLVTWDHSYDDDDWEPQDFSKNVEDPVLREILVRVQEEGERKRRERTDLIRSQLTERAAWMAPPWHSLYPLYDDYAPGWNVPDDIAPDWDLALNQFHRWYEQWKGYEPESPVFVSEELHPREEL